MHVLLKRLPSILNTAQSHPIAMFSNKNICKDQNPRRPLQFLSVLSKMHDFWNQALHGYTMISQIWAQRKSSWLSPCGIHNYLTRPKHDSLFPKLQISSYLHRVLAESTTEDSHGNSVGFDLQSYFLPAESMIEICWDVPWKESAGGSPVWVESPLCPSSKIIGSRIYSKIPQLCVRVFLLVSIHKLCMYDQDS